jgi:hypothetical protein
MAVALAAVLKIGARTRGIEAVDYGLTCAVVYLCFMASLILVNRFFVLPRAARRQLSQLKEFGGPLKFGVSSPHIVLTTKNSFSETPTEDFLKWAENGKSILLYRSDRQFNFVPRRVISEAFHRCLLAELTRAGVSKAGFSNGWSGGRLDGVLRLKSTHSGPQPPNSGGGPCWPALSHAILAVR